MNAAAAIARLAEAGVDRAALAAELGVHRSTVWRWAAGRRRPNSVNLAALRTLVDRLHQQVVARVCLFDAGQDAALTAARLALHSQAEAAELDELADRIRADLLRSGALVRVDQVDVPCLADAEDLPWAA